MCWGVRVCVCVRLCVCLGVLLVAESGLVGIRSCAYAFVAFRSSFPPYAHTWPGLSGPHQAGRQPAVSRQRVCLGSGGVGLAAVPCLPLTAALHSRLSDTTSRLHSCDLGLAVGWSARWPRSGDELTECAPGFPSGLGSLWLRVGFGVLSLLVVSSFPFAPFGGGGTRSGSTTSTTCSRPVRHMVMRVRLIPYDRRGLLSVPCSLGCMTPRGLYRPAPQKR